MNVYKLSAKLLLLSISSSLVDSGILPTIPGLFSSQPQVLPTADVDDKSNKSAKSNHATSESLRVLIRDMEAFKSYLIQVDDCRSKLAQLEVTQKATKRCLKTAAANVSWPRARVLLQRTRLRD